MHKTEAQCLKLPVQGHTSRVGEPGFHLGWVLPQRLGLSQDACTRKCCLLGRTHLFQGPSKLSLQVQGRKEMNDYAQGRKAQTLSWPFFPFPILSLAVCPLLSLGWWHDSAVQLKVELSASLLPASPSGPTESGTAKPGVPF